MKIRVPALWAADGEMPGSIAAAMAAANASTTVFCIATVIPVEHARRSASSRRAHLEKLATARRNPTHVYVTGPLGGRTRAIGARPGLTPPRLLLFDAALAVAGQSSCKAQRGRSLGTEPGGTAGGLRRRRSGRPAKPVYHDGAATFRPRAGYSPQSRSGRGYRAGFVRPDLAPRPQLRPRSRHRHGVARPHRTQPMFRRPAAARAGSAARRQGHGKLGGSVAEPGRPDGAQPRRPASPGLPRAARGESAPGPAAGLLSRPHLRGGGGPAEGPARHGEELDPPQPDPAQGLHGPMKYDHPELR